MRRGTHTGRNEAGVYDIEVAVEVLKPQVDIVDFTPAIRWHVPA